MEDERKARQIINIIIFIIALVGIMGAVVILLLPGSPKKEKAEVMCKQKLGIVETIQGNHILCFDGKERWVEMKDEPK